MKRSDYRGSGDGRVMQNMMSRNAVRIKWMGMAVSVMAGLIFFVNACIPAKYLAVEDSSGYHRHIKLKFIFQDADKKQSGKILMKFDRNRTRMLFLSSLNQVYLELFVEKGMAWLVNTRKKKFWKGKFQKLIRDMWQIDLTMDELEQLLTEGIFPENKLKSAGFDFTLQRDPVSGNPRQIRLFNGDISILLKVQDQAVRRGGIPFDPDFSRFKKSDLHSVLADE